MKYKVSLLILVSLTALDGFAQEKIESYVIARIKEEAYQHSQVMETLSYLSDVYGPRLSGSPAYYEAAQWSKQRLESWGIENVRFDSYGDDLRGWEIESYSLEMITPRYMHITAIPDAWTMGTDGEVTGPPVMVDHRSLEALKKLSGQLRGKILMSPEFRSQSNVLEGIFTDEELAKAERQMNPNPARGLSANNVKSSIEMLRGRLNRGESEADRINRFLLDEGVAAVIRGSSKAPGTLDARQQRYSKKGEMKPVPHFVISKEQHARMVRMLDKGSEITLKLHLDVKFNENPDYHTNIIADIPGTDSDLKSQLVMVGGHLDSYSSGTGAADNGAGSATNMEALRILKALDIKPRRTIRLVLWGGEEQGMGGSLGYIKKYVGDIFTGKDRGELSRISVYFNHDNNGHRIRGIFTQGNEAIRPIFERYLKPFHAVGAETVSVEFGCCTDNIGFDALNIPAYSWIQDPEHYNTTQIHTNMDVVDYVSESTMQHNAAIIAAFVYKSAMRDEMMPRRKALER
jgi:carboxypeptidase Q